MDVKNILDHSPLSEIANKILPYLQFYDTLYYLNNKFMVLHQVVKNDANEIATQINQWKPLVVNLINISTNA